MTLEEAVKEARRRWGLAGAVQYIPNNRAGEYEVGGWGMGDTTYPFGYGSSWEEAFTNAGMGMVEVEP